MPIVIFIEEGDDRTSIHQEFHGVFALRPLEVDRDVPPSCDFRWAREEAFLPMCTTCLGSPPNLSKIVVAGFFRLSARFPDIAMELPCLLVHRLQYTRRIKRWTVLCGGADHLRRKGKEKEKRSNPNTLSTAMFFSPAKFEIWFYFLGQSRNGLPVRHCSTRSAAAPPK